MRAAWLVLLAGCAHKSGEVTHDDPPPEALDALRVRSVNASVGADGVLEVAFDLGADATAFALEASLPDDEWFHLAALRDPDGAVALDCADWEPNTAYALTDACWDYAPVVFDFPVLPGQTVRAGRWTALYETEAAAGTVATVTLIERPADTDDTTDLYAQLLVAEGLPARLRDPAVYDRAVQHWMELWGDAGIALHPRWGTVDVGPNTSDNWAWRETADGAGARGELTIVFTELQQPGVLGYVTAMPGPVLPGRDGVLVVDVPAHAGRNGRLEASEADTLGETIAHEALHYAGLPHPADGSGSPDSWDALDDTLDCTDWPTCNDELGDNLMYNTTVYTDDGDRVPQVELTADQRHVVRHWAGGL